MLSEFKVFKVYLGNIVYVNIYSGYVVVESLVQDIDFCKILTFGNRVLHNQAKSTEAARFYA